MEKAQWKSKVFSKDVFEEPVADFLCCLCCPGFTSSLAKTKYDDSSLCFNCFCVSGASSRNTIREGYGVEGNWLTDCFMGICCPWFTARQMMHEVKDHKNETGNVEFINPIKKTLGEFKDLSVSSCKKKESKEEPKAVPKTAQSSSSPPVAATADPELVIVEPQSNPSS